MSILHISRNTPPARPTSHTCDLETLQLWGHSPWDSSVLSWGPRTSRHLPGPGPRSPPPPGQDHPKADTWQKQTRRGRAASSPASTRRPHGVLGTPLTHPVPDLHTPLEFLKRWDTRDVELPDKTLINLTSAVCWGPGPTAGQTRIGPVLWPAGCSGEEACPVRVLTTRVWLPFQTPVVSTNFGRTNQS